MKVIEKRLLITAAILGALGVILGAFGAHAFSKVLTLEQLLSYKTAIKYQFYHLFLMIAVALVPLLKVKLKSILFWLIFTGVVLFSGSIYLLVLGEPVFGVSFKSIGFITPIGGLLLIVAWIVFAVNLLKMKL